MSQQARVIKPRRARSRSRDAVAARDEEKSSANKVQCSAKGESGAENGFGDGWSGSALRAASHSSSLSAVGRVKADSPDTTAPLPKKNAGRSRRSHQPAAGESRG